MLRPACIITGLLFEELKKDLKRLLNDEATFWRTRAKQYWLQEDDRNTKFFYAITNGRRRANRIVTINDDGVA